jgi:transposase
MQAKSSGQFAARLTAQQLELVAMPETQDICCVSLELSQSKWVCAFAPPEGAKGSLHTIKAGDHARLVEWLDRQRVRAELALGRPLQLAVCYEVGYDGFWLARILLKVGIRTVVFDPASFLKPRRGRWAKTDRLDAEEMTRILRSWLGGDSSVARDVRIPTVEEEDAKRLCRERKTLVNDRTRLVGRIKGLCALHGIMVPGKRISRRWVAHLDEHRTGDGRPMPPYLRREIERLLRRYAVIEELIAEVELDCQMAIVEPTSPFPEKEKVQRLATLGGVGPTSALLLVAEVYHRRFDTRRHLASFIGLAPTPYASGDVSRDRGINKAGTKLARQTLVELAWSWLRYQPESALSIWWRQRFAGAGMRGRKVGIVALARRLAIAFWQFLENGLVPEGATVKG